MKRSPWGTPLAIGIWIAWIIATPKDHFILYPLWHGIVFGAVLMFVVILGLDILIALWRIFVYKHLLSEAERKKWREEK